MVSDPIENRGEFLVLLVKATAGARKNEIGETINGRLKVKITAVAEKGKANKAIVKLLSKTLGIASSQIELASGQTNSQKSFLIAGIKESELREKLGLNLQ